MGFVCVKLLLFENAALHCNDVVFDVSNFTDEWSHISNHFSDKLHPSFESGNSLADQLQLRLTNNCLTTNIYCNKIRKCCCFPTEGAGGGGGGSPPGLEVFSTVRPPLTSVCAACLVLQTRCAPGSRRVRYSTTVLLMVHW